MAHLITRFVKWFISVSAFIYGSAFLMMVEENNNVRSLFFVICCYGVVYWMSKNTYEGSKKLFFFTLGIVLVAGIIPFFYTVPFFLFDISFYLSWNIWAALIGMPIMGYFFVKDE